LKFCRNKMAALLLHCVENVPAYRDMQHITELIHEDALQALNRFPLLTKGGFSADPGRYRDPGCPAGELIPISSGGSTGEPVSFYIDRRTVEHYEGPAARPVMVGITPEPFSLMVWGLPWLTEVRTLNLS
jgi:phenylacetate-CoA ligase